MRYNIKIGIDYISIDKVKNGKYSFEEMISIINFDDWIVYKATAAFKILNKNEYNKYCKMLLTKKDIKKEIDFLNSIGYFNRKFLIKNPHPDIKKLKIIDEI